VSFHDFIALAQTADIPQTWIGVVGTVITAFTGIITRLLFRLDKRMAAIEQAMFDLAQANLFRVLAGDAAANTKQEARDMLSAMNRRRPARDAE
jgi:hypothetical protein